MGKMITLAGGNFEAVRRKVIATPNTLDAYIARLPGLVHYIDPDDIVDTSDFKERGSGAQVTGTLVPNLLVTPALDNKISLNFNPLEVTDLTINSYSFTRSLTIVQVICPLTASLAGTELIGLWSVRDSVTQMFARLQTTSKNLLFSNQVNAATWAGAGAHFVANAVYVVAMTADLDTLEMGIWVDDFTTPRATAVASSGLAARPLGKYVIGQSDPAHKSWKGLIGKMLIFDRDYSQGELAPKFETLLEKLRDYYSL